MKILSSVLTAGLITTLVGCSSSENLRNTSHTDTSLVSQSGAQNSERFVVTRTDGSVWSRTVEGNTDPMTIETTGEGLFSVTGEGTVGGANIVFPSEDPGVAPTVVQAVGQNNLYATNVKITLPNGAEASADDFKILSSETRDARSRSLEQWVTMYASLTDAQKTAIAADQARFIEAVSAASPLLSDVLKSIIPVK